MTRIYTNIPAMTAQKALQANYAGLETSLERLSTGLRINSGKDDPAGLIASEMIRSEITGIKAAISNTSKANSMIAVADSALNQITILLNEVRGLVTEGANDAAMSPEMINANQFQIDASLDAIDRISAMTTFMGKKLLDGSLDFVTQGVPRNEIQDLTITQAQFGTKMKPLDVNVTVREAAEKAALYYTSSILSDGVTLSIGGNLGKAVQQFSKGSSITAIADFVNANTDVTGVMALVQSNATYGTLVTSSTGPNNDIIIRAGTAGEQAGFIEVKYTYGNDRGVVVEYGESYGAGTPATINVQLQTQAWEKARATHVDPTPGVHDNNALEFIANVAGAKYNDVSINYVNGNLVDENFMSNNPSGIVRGINAVYSDGPTAATALMGDVNGLKALASLNAGEYLKFSASQTGTDFNDVRIEFINDPTRLMIQAGFHATAVYISPPANPNKILQIYVDTAGTVGPVTTFADVQSALNRQGSFSVTFSDAAVGSETVKIADTANGGTPGSIPYGYTDKSGSDGKTLLVYANTVLSPSVTQYVNPVLNQPITSFANFDPATNDSFLMNATRAGYNNTDLVFKAAGNTDPVFSGTSNVAAVYDTKMSQLVVYIRSMDAYAPPLSGTVPPLEAVTFDEIATAIANASNVEGGTFNVTLGGAAGTKEIDLSDLTFQEPASLPFAGLLPGEEVFVRSLSTVDVGGIKTPVNLQDIRFVQIQPTTGTPPAPDIRLQGGNAGAEYDPQTGLVTVFVREDGVTTFGDVATAVGNIVYPGTVPAVHPFTFDMSDPAIGANAFDLSSAIPELSIPASLNGIPSSVTQGGITLNSTFPAQVNVEFVAVDNTEATLLAPGLDVGAVFSNCVPHSITVYLRKDALGTALLPTYADVDTVLQNLRVPVLTSTDPAEYGSGYFHLTAAVPMTDPFDLGSTGPVGFKVNNGQQNGVTTTISGVHSAFDVKQAFDLSEPESRGNERAAGLFTVYRSRDNDGTGSLYSVVFTDVFKNGVDGGGVISTAEEVVAALNNSASWGQEMTKEMLQQWIKDGTMQSKTDPPVVVASLAPGNHGLSKVSVFTEVAYYGDPHLGTGVQFLGPDNSLPIRFVVGGTNTPLSLDWTSVPGQTANPKAILSASNPNADLIISGKQTGLAQNDVLINFVRAYEDPNALPPIIREYPGWAEFDPGVSFSQAMIVFEDPTTGKPIQNLDFTVTANDRGDGMNNVSVQMRQNTTQKERILVSYNQVKGILEISLSSAAVNPATAVPGPITANEIIAAINADVTGRGVSDSGFTASLNYAQDPSNNGMGTFESAGLSSKYGVYGNTGTTGGHVGGTLTVYLVGEGPSFTSPPTANQVVDIITSDDMVSRMFSASTYVTGASAGQGAINFVKDNYLVTSGGVPEGEEGVLVVHLATDASGFEITTAQDLVKYWEKLSAEETRGISASILRPPGTIWDICADDGGWGILPPTPTKGDDCKDIVYLDSYFVGWADSQDDPMIYVPSHAQGTMTSVNGDNASFTFTAKRTGPDYNGYTLSYVYNSDLNLSGRYEDNTVNADGTVNENGMKLSYDPVTKKITVFIVEKITTANDVKQLIENDSVLKQIFEVNLRGNGTGLVTLQDDTLLTTGGTEPPSVLNGAKLLFAQDPSDYSLEFVSANYGSRQFVEVMALSGVFNVRDANGVQTERTTGKDADVLVNGIKAVADGLSVQHSSATLQMYFNLSDRVGAGYTTNFQITGGGATFQIGPEVVSNQQLTVGIPSVNTISLGGPSGRLYQLRNGNDASLTSGDLNLAYRIVDEAIVNVTTIRGRLGSIQKLGFETNMNVLNDTLEAISTAESAIRDTDFASETSNLTRQQVLVQSNISTLGIANQLPNYILGLLR
ncbi:MAG: flagellin [Thermoguttaceae bacterium]